MFNIETCPDCNHSLHENKHGFDQDDFIYTDSGDYEHSGHCKYCVICSPGLLKLLATKRGQQPKLVHLEGWKSDGQLI